MVPRFDVAVIGGGFFGSVIALHLRAAGLGVVVLEAGERLLGRASYNNQARVHNGYHYPRSLLTARRSHANYSRFIADYGDCLDDSFAKYYAVARTYSKVTARQFVIYFEQIGAPIAPAPEGVRRLFDDRLIEDVFAVRECAFDADRLARRLARQLAGAGVDVRLRWEVQRLAARSGAGIRLSCAMAEGPRELEAGHVFNCTYSRINHVLAASGLPNLPLKHELTELALVDVPAALQALGITVMCGPFFSVMPFPALRQHTLSHVRFTPHEAWHDAPGSVGVASDQLARIPRRSNFPCMLRDASRYVPALAAAVHTGSLWEVKTILPASEVDDSRPILLRTDFGLPGLHCVLGAKIDNIYDALDVIDGMIRRRRAG